MLDLLMMGGAVLAVGAFTAYGYWFSRERTVRRAIRGVRATPIAQVRGGLVKLRGRVTPLDVLEAPLSGAPCVYYEVVIQDGKGEETSWSTVHREVEERDFVLEDGTGRARIEMVAVRADVKRDGEWKSGVLQEPTARMQALLARCGVAATGLLFNRSLRYREARIEVGAEVAVLGWAGEEVDPEPSGAGHGYRDAAKRVVVRADGTKAVQITDDPSALE